MKKIGRTLALAAGLAALASCMGGPDDEDSMEGLTASVPLQLCHNMDRRLRGRMASVWKVVDSNDLVAVDVDGIIVCVDTIEETLSVGLIAIPADTFPSGCEGFCDGTPIPAAKFNEAARRRGRTGRSDISLY